MLNAKTYANFKAALAASNCQKCALSRSRTHIVVDRGNPKARVVLIGEAPGANEDLQGRVFVGRGGKLLDGMMKEIGFDTDQDSLVINVVKCRPPDNRAPVSQEAAACFPFLRKQLDLVKPAFILLLGATALKHVVPDKAALSMGEQVGKFFACADYPGIEFMVLYHPAFILRDPRKRPLMAEHLRRFKARWDLQN